jgi:hypothetical protein
MSGADTVFLGPLLVKGEPFFPGVTVRPPQPTLTSWIFRMEHPFVESDQSSVVLPLLTLRLGERARSSNLALDKRESATSPSYRRRFEERFACAFTPTCPHLTHLGDGSAATARQIPRPTGLDLR